MGVSPQRLTEGDSFHGGTGNRRERRDERRRESQKHEGWQTRVEENRGKEGSPCRESNK